MVFGIPHFKKPQWVWTDIDIPGLRILKLAHPKRTEGLAPDKAGFCRDGIPAPCTSCRHWNHRQKQSSKPTRSTRHSIISHHISSYRNISHHISSHLIISPHIASYLIISHHISSYLIISHHIASYRIISHHISAYPHVSSYVLISPHISAYRIISPHVSSYIPISPHISSYILISPHISSCLIISPHISSNLIISQHISSHLIIPPHIASYLIISPHISSYLLIYPHISSYLSISLICRDFWGSHTRGQNSSADNFFGPRSTSLWQLLLKQMTQVISKRLWSNTRHHFSSGIRVISMSHTRLRSMLQKKCGEGRSHWSH